MKELALLILITITPLLVSCQKKVSYKHSITYDTAQLRYLDKSIQATIPDSNNVFFDDSEFCIKFKGGDKALVKYFAANFIMPSDDKQKNISGKVLVTFTVNEKGEVGDIKIVEGLSEEIDSEVIRVVSMMPKWIWDCKTKPKRPVKTRRFAPFIIE